VLVGSLADRRTSSPRTARTAWVAGLGFTALALPACARPVDPPSQPPREIREIEIPFHFRTLQPIVLARVNGGPWVPFMVDTGSTIHLIDDSAATSTGLSPGSASKLYGAGEAGFEIRYAEPLSLDANGFVWEGQRAAVMHLGYPKEKHFAGILGAPILMRYAVQFDFEKNVMRLLDPAAYEAPKGATQVPFKLQDDLPVVSMIVDSGTGPHEARLMVDTGGGCFVDLNRPFVDKHQLVAETEGDDLVKRPGLGGTSPFLYREGRQVTLGGIAFEKPKLGFSRARSGSSASDARDGVLCNALLIHFRRVTFDYKRKVLVLEK
jgi:hypothetical protein